MSGAERRLRIAFFCDYPPDQMPAFIREDLRTCEALGEVRWTSVVSSQRWRPLIGPPGWLPTRTGVELLRWCDVAVQWFAARPGAALAARALGKPLLVIAGGYDVAHEPAHDYGMMIDLRTRALAIATLYAARRVLALSKFQLDEVRRWAPGADADYLYLGAEPAIFSPAGEREPQVLMVSRIGVDHVRKGLSLLVATARLLPDVPFRLVGEAKRPSVLAELRAAAPANLELVGGLSHRQVAAEMQRATVVAQLSFHESFGCAVAEAMMCGCTPVVTRCGALPEVVGETGYYASPGDAASAAAAIRQALAQPRAELARQRALTRYPAAARRAGLQGELERLAVNHR